MSTAPDGGAPLTGGPVELTELGGCLDTTVYLTNREDTAMVEVTWPDAVAFVERERGVGAHFRASSGFGAPGGPQVWFTRGQHVSDFVCGAVVRPGSSAHRGRLVSGRLELIITLSDSANPRGPWGEANLTAAVFEDPAGGELHLGELWMGATPL